MPSLCILSALDGVLKGEKYAMWVIAQENTWKVKRIYRNKWKSIVSVELSINRAIPFAVTFTTT